MWVFAGVLHYKTKHATISLEPSAEALVGILSSSEHEQQQTPFHAFVLKSLTR